MIKLFNKPKKFRVRVTHYLGEYYKIQFAYFRFIPFWRCLYKWGDMGVPDGFAGYQVLAFRVREAEAFAANFKSIEDVKAWDKEQSEKEIKFRLAEKQYYEQALPYSTKRIL